MPGHLHHYPIQLLHVSLPISNSCTQMGSAIHLYNVMQEIFQNCNCTKNSSSSNTHYTAIYFPPLLSRILLIRPAAHDIQLKLNN